MLNWFKRSPFVMTFVMMSAVGLLAVGATVVYALKVQPDPQVIRKLEPLTNAGVDASGLTLDQWIARGNAAEKYQPVPKSVFKHGEPMFVLRQDCFVNKVASGQVFRAFYGGDRRNAAGDLDLTKTSGTQFILDPVPIPSRSDGCPVKNHLTVISSKMPAQTWTYAPGVDFYKNPMQPSIRIHFRPVVIEVVN